MIISSFQVRRVLSILFLVGFLSNITQGFTFGTILQYTPVPHTRIEHVQREILASHDPDGPSIILYTPVNNSFVSGIAAGPVPVFIDVIPKSDAICDRDARILVNGTWFNMTDVSNGNFSSFIYPWDLSGPAGPNKTVSIMVYDNNSRSNTFIVNVTSDNCLPDCHFITPLNETYVTQDIIIRVNATDFISSISNASIFFIDPFGYRSESITLQHVAGEWRYTWSCKSNRWPMGQYQICLNVTDGAGNENWSTVDVLLDYTNPFLEIISPLNQSIISRIQDIELRIGDPVSEISNISLRLTNGTALALIQTSSQDFYARLNTSYFPDGQIEMLVSVSNYAGLINSTRLTYIVDNKVPNGVVFISEQIRDIANFSYMCNDSNAITRLAWHIDQGLLKDIPITSQGNVSITTKNFRDGIHLLQLIIEDGASPSNRKTIEKQIIIDNTNPEVSVQNLYSGIVINPQHVIKVKVYDENQISLSYSLDYGAYQSVQYDTQYGIWSIALSSTGLISGTHSISLVGRDITGNVDEDFYIFTFYYNPSLTEQVLAWFVKWGFVVISSVAAAFFVVILVIRLKQKKIKFKIKTKKVRR